jgi:hypothetical protein
MSRIALKVVQSRSQLCSCKAESTMAYHTIALDAIINPWRGVWQVEPHAQQKPLACLLGNLGVSISTVCARVIRRELNISYPKWERQTILRHCSLAPVKDLLVCCTECCRLRPAPS